MALKDSEILDLAYKVGWRKSGDLERVLAITLAESSNNPRARNYCCVGLMQINVLVHKQYSADAMFDPEANMRAGFALWQQSGWRPWNSSRLGQLAWGPRARASLAVWHASPGVGTQGTGGAVGEAASGAVDATVNAALPGLEGVSDALERLVRWLTTPANVGRLAIAVLGGAVIVAGVVMLGKPLAESAVDTVAKVKPI